MSPEAIAMVWFQIACGELTPFFFFSFSQHLTLLSPRHFVLQHRFLGEKQKSSLSGASFHYTKPCSFFWTSSYPLNCCLRFMQGDSDDSSKQYIFFLKFNKVFALCDRCFGSVVRLKKLLALVSSASRPFFSVNILSYHFLFVMPYRLPVHLEKQQKPHHVITPAVFNNRNCLCTFRD